MPFLNPCHPSPKSAEPCPLPSKPTGSPRSLRGSGGRGEWSSPLRSLEEPLTPRIACNMELGTVARLNRALIRPRLWGRGRSHRLSLEETWLSPAAERWRCCGGGKESGRESSGGTKSSSSDEMGEG